MKGRVYCRIVGLITCGTFHITQSAFHPTFSPCTHYAFPLQSSGAHSTELKACLWKCTWCTAVLGNCARCSLNKAGFCVCFVMSNNGATKGSQVNSCENRAWSVSHRWHGRLAHSSQSPFPLSAPCVHYLLQMHNRITTTPRENKANIDHLHMWAHLHIWTFTVDHCLDWAWDFGVFVFNSNVGREVCPPPAPVTIGFTWLGLAVGFLHCHHLQQCS